MPWYYRVILHIMKTAISVPDPVFHRVERRVGELGVSRSEFFTRAAERYLVELDQEELSARINAAVESVQVSDSERSQWTGAGLRSLDLATHDDEW